MAGLAPVSGAEVNNVIGNALRQFTHIKEIINQHHAWLLTADLKLPPYDLSAEDETLLKSAVADLDATLDGHDMTFISRLIGLPL